MKRTLKALLIITLSISALLIYPIVEEEHDHDHFHVYAFSSDCPYCTGGNLPAPLYGTVVVDNFQDSTCTETGYVGYHCETPGCSYRGQETIPLKDHTPQTEITQRVTCTNPGFQVTKCSECGTQLSSSQINALGHDYSISITKQATCLQKGIETATCTRCGDSYQNEIPALGHNYKVVVNKKATCEEEGQQTSTCTRCNNSFKTTLKALGHDFEIEEKEATCTEDGYINKTCKRCDEEEKEIIKALGHDLENEKVVKEATCEEDGLKSGVCKRCEETIETTIPKLGHKYPEEWTIEKETSFFSEGLESKTCPTCQSKIEQVIPKKDSTPLVVGGVGGLTVLGGAAFIFLKSKAASSAAKLASEVVKEGAEAFKPSFEDKTVLVCSSEEIVDVLKKQTYLEVTTCDFEEIKDSTIENEPDILICNINNEEEYQNIINLKHEELKEFDIGLLMLPELINDHKEELESLKEDKELVNYLSLESSAYDVLVNLILPILKPSFKSDETLDNIAQITDILGIPGISTVINAFVAGRDIKATLEEGELGVSEKATIISDVASILGFDTISSVVNLVNDVEDIKTALDKDAGAYERKEGISAGKDIVDVVGEIINKD